MLSSGLSCAFLYSQSPIALEIAIIPLTLPSSTKPPALYTLLFSKGKSGLWSIDKSFAYPLLAITHLVSPAFATYTSVFVINATQQVHPAWYARSEPSKVVPLDIEPCFFEIAVNSFFAYSDKSILSKSKNTSVNAYL